MAMYLDNINTVKGRVAYTARHEDHNKTEIARRASDLVEGLEATITKVKEAQKYLEDGATTIYGTTLILEAMRRLNAEFNGPEMVRTAACLHEADVARFIAKGAKGGVIPG